MLQDHHHRQVGEIQPVRRFGNLANPRPLFGQHASAQSHRGKDARPDVHRLLHRGLHVCGGLHHVRRDGESSREPPQISKAFAGFGREVDQGTRHKEDEFVHQQVGEGKQPDGRVWSPPRHRSAVHLQLERKDQGTIQTNATGEATSQAGRFGSLGSILSTRRTRAKPSTNQHRCHKPQVMEDGQQEQSRDQRLKIDF